jgi:general transcription factor 3C polypeptide 5 (transcription factor C subunit 1)
VSTFSLKKILSYVSYLFKNGPWKFTYIKFGYDPRVDKEAVKYQVFSIGVNNRGYMERKQNAIDCRARNYDRVQFCELEEANIQECLKHTLHENRNNHHRVCNEKFGWLDKKVHNYIVKNLRDNMKNELLKLNREFIQKNNIERSGINWNFN